MNKFLESINAIEVEGIEININISIKIVRGKIILTAPEIEGKVLELLSQEISRAFKPTVKKPLTDKYINRALPKYHIDIKELIKLINKHIENAYLHIEKANSIVKFLEKK